MNAERLRAAIDLLLNIEKNTNFQSQLDVLAAAMAKLVEVNSAENQRSVSAALTELESEAASSFALNRAQHSSIAGINAQYYFSADFLNDIKRTINENAIAPAVAQKELVSSIDSRKSYLNILRSTRSGLRNLGIEPADLNSGQSQISILIPRKLFHDDLDGLQKELKTINSIIRTFYELSNVTPGPIPVKEISTSDPTFFLGMDVGPLIMLGLAIKWAIDVIKGSHDIKKIADSARTASLPEDLVKQLEANIQVQVDQRVQSHMDEMFATFKGDAGRANELATPTKLALEQLLQRIERGMIIEIHAAPPTITADGNNDIAAQMQRDFDTLNGIATTITYPQIDGEPVLRLTSSDDNLRLGKE